MARLWWSNRSRPVDRLYYESLVMSIINLALVLVYDSVCFIRLFWLLISSLG